ncbi:hypothetical protein FFLO_01646 [Filobasidium floriforme]|uniref:Uncharacterized protein n=1 Tax=Filobasidium floriforme TaxID=5210 RepID=A0A8K0JPL7_9TREE|nr:uncharacterized protein HD553DRAFT_317122 [Filobasidium floriforme]KAG7562956.1 hypothetical protein FFLO_01646 [Filobasidium floriforme]KAH8080591.1 hypothetical protein HD553DRAFT_317122 [Filobasidium floriforme]
MDKLDLVSYIPAAFRSFPAYLQQHIHHARNPWSFFEYYQNAPDSIHTIMPLFWTSLTLTYVLGLVTGNVSQIDRQWTFLPIAYSLHFVLYPLFNNNGEAFLHNLPRLCLMWSLMVVWGVRLTAHTARRGLYNFFDEDYRWQIWRDQLPTWLFQLFHLGFIAIAQSLLLAAMSLPYQNVLLTPRPTQSSSALGLPYGLGATDVILTVLTLLTIYTQFMADNQQYHFQTYKQHVKKSQSQDDINVNIPRNVTTYKQGPFDITWTPKDAQRGFITKGLWAWSRHPNFACEMTFWALQGLFPLLSASFGSVGAGLTVGEKRGMVLPSPIIPAIAYSCLFIASTWFTESITAPKYPAYKSYQALVGQFAPQVTVFKGIISLLLGTRTRLAEELGWVGSRDVKGKKVQ